MGLSHWYFFLWPWAFSCHAQFLCITHTHTRARTRVHARMCVCLCVCVCTQLYMNTLSSTHLWTQRLISTFYYARTGSKAHLYLLFLFYPHRRSLLLNYLTAIHCTSLITHQVQHKNSVPILLPSARLDEPEYHHNVGRLRSPVLHNLP